MGQTLTQLVKEEPHRAQYFGSACERQIGSLAIKFLWCKNTFWKQCEGGNMKETSEASDESVIKVGKETTK